MAEFEEKSDESEVSDFEDSEDFTNFDLVKLDENERRCLERQRNALVGDSDDDEEDIEGFEPEEVYAPRNFVWTKLENQRDLFQFSERVGPTRVLDGSRKALEYFQIFYSDEVFENIVRLTNLNATIKRARGDTGVWTDLTLNEIKAFYGILIIMDTMKFDRDEFYWSESDKHWLLGSKIGQVMSRDRFFQIRRYLHFSDDRCVAKDKLHKVRYLLDHIRHAFQTEYVPHKQLTVDEAIIPFKGRLSVKQYMKDKPVKFGIKIWVLADALTSYCYNFEVYIGKNAEVVNGNFGLLSKVVIALTKPIEMKGYEIYTNNFYTSPHLADYLYQRKTYLCGTIRTNCKDYPKALVQSNAAARKMCRGTSDWLMSGPLLASFWKDNHIVYYLSSCHRPVADQTTERRNKDGTRTRLPCTHTVTDYAKYMGGVDRLDQSSRLNKEKKTMQWYHRMEIKLRDCALYNAFVLEGTVVDHNPPRKRARDFLSFRMDVAHELIGNIHQVRRAFKRPRQLNIDEERLDEKAHWPVSSGSADRLCEVCNKKHKNYKANHPAVPLVEDQDGGWSEWATWSSCTARCDGGLRWRSRNCDSPEPIGRGKNCEEHTLEGQECNSHPCKGIWSCWGEWSPCSASCGVESVTMRTRYCQSLPPGKFFTIPCHGNNSETLPCQQMHCSGPAIASPLRLSNTGNYTLTNMLIAGLVCFLVGGSLSLILFAYISRFRTAMRKVKAHQKEENEDDGGETSGTKSGQQSLVSLHSMDIFRSKVYAIDIATEENMNKKDVNMVDRSCMLKSFSMKDL